MRPITHRFTLDMHDTQSQISIPVYCGDSGRKLFITLSEGGKPYEIGEGCCAYINARTPANTTQSLMCNIANNTIEFDFSENNDSVNMIAVVGLTHCDVTLFDADGYIVTAPRFTFVVVDQISNPRNVELSSGDVSLLSSWTSTFASWDTAETGRVSAENNRIGKEIERDNAEKGPNGRAANELERQSNELTRQSQEATRQRLYEEAKESLDTVIAKANEAKASADASAASADASAASADASAASAESAKASENHAQSLADNTLISSLGAADASIKAKASETNAKASEENAKRIADEVRSAAEATPAYLDYLAHYNYRVHQLTANFAESDKMPSATGRGIGILPLNVNAVVQEDFEGGQYTDYSFIIMHPKASGEFSANAGMGECGCVVVAKGIEHLNIGRGVRAIDLSLFTGNMPFPSLSVTDSTIGQVTVQKGRKAELMAMTNWSDCNIVEVETW